MFACELGEYSEKIIAMIAQNLTPDEICIGLSLCQNPKPKDQGCTLCKFAVAKLDDLLENKESEAEIKEALENICGYLPGQYAKQCKTFVDTYTDMLIDLIAKDLTPDEV